MKSIQAIASLLCDILHCGVSLNAQNVLKATGWMPGHTSTSRIESPAVNNERNLYAVNYKRKGTIGIVHPDDSRDYFLVLSEGSTGSNIHFGKNGNMYVMDYMGHNILKVDIRSKKISIFAHEPKVNQPNDIAFVSNGDIYASNSDWSNQEGQLWLITSDVKAFLSEMDMGTTNGVAVSKDGKRLYINGSAQLEVWVYDICPDGILRSKRLLHISKGCGMDGMKCNKKGNLYVCCYNKGTITLLNPQGDLAEEIQLTGRQLSNLTFGGPGHRQCYVMLWDRGCFETFKAPYPGKE